MRSVEKRPPPLSSVAASSSSARRPQSFPPTIFSPQPLLVLPWSGWSVVVPARPKTLLHPSPTTNRILLISAHGFFTRNFIEGERVQSCRSFLLRWLIRRWWWRRWQTQGPNQASWQLFVRAIITGDWPPPPQEGLGAFPLWSVTCLRPAPLADCWKKCGGVGGQKRRLIMRHPRPHTRPPSRPQKILSVNERMWWKQQPADNPVWSEMRPSNPVHRFLVGADIECAVDKPVHKINWHHSICLN